MDPLLWGPLLWPPGLAVVDIVKIVETRAAAEAVGVPMYSTMGVPASPAKVPAAPAVEATAMDPLVWGLSLWPPGLPAVAVVEIVVTRVAAEVARPVEESLLMVFLGGVSREVFCEVSCEGSLVRSLFLRGRRLS